MKKFLIIFCLIIMTLGISGCGKSARPIPYPDSGYPHSYPYDK